MLTVLAIEESLLNEIGDFEPLLRNVADRGEYKICTYYRYGKTLQEAIPTLFNRDYITEGELLNYNILIVSDDRDCFDDNPFGGCYCASPDGEVDESTLNDSELNEVAKMLGIVPAHSTYSYKMPASKKESILWNIEVDDSLKKDKINQYKIDDFTRPQKIFLMAVQKKYDVDIDSSPAYDTVMPAEHPQFSVHGRYPANCRFFKFNLSSKSNKTTMNDYFRLWMTIISFAYNDGSDYMFFSPDSLYTIDTDIDSQKISEQICKIYSRVHFVKKYTESGISNIKRLRSLQSSKSYDMPELTSSVVVSFESDENGLYLNKKRFGLAKDCPVYDETEYFRQRTDIEKNIKEYLKAPKRAIRRSVGTTKEQGVFVPPKDEFIYLSREQEEDLEEAINQMEIDLMKADSIDITYPQKNAKERKEADKRTRSVMRKRSTVSAIVVSSIAMFVALLISFVPYIINAIVKVGTNETIGDALFVVGVCILILAISGIITLFVLRVPLSSAFYHFKMVINALVGFVKNQATAYTDYLSMLSGFMKHHSFQRYLKTNVDGLMKEEENLYILNRNYCDDVERLCKKWADGLNFNLEYNESDADTSFVLDEYPNYNVVYSFTLDGDEQVINYNRRKSTLSTPYSFITSLNILKEEVYEQ